MELGNLENFKEPMTVDDTTDVRSLLPEMNDIPHWYKNKYKWEQTVSIWFFEGISKSAFTPKNGIDANKAFKHLAAIISSWDLRHEHKIEGAAYLMSLWFDIKIK